MKAEFIDNNDNFIIIIKLGSVYDMDIHEHKLYLLDTDNNGNNNNNKSSRSKTLNNLKSRADYKFTNMR